MPAKVTGQVAAGTRILAGFPGLNQHSQPSYSGLALHALCAHASRCKRAVQLCSVGSGAKSPRQHCMGCLRSCVSWVVAIMSSRHS
jgi:hypothetical protein